MSFGARLSEARRKKGLTQADLGKGLGTDGKDAGKAVVYGWEKDLHFPRADQLAMLCERLGVGADYLLFGKVAESALLPEVAALASKISEMEREQLDFVLQAVRSSVTFSEQALAQRQAQSVEPASNQQEARSSPKRIRRA